MAIDVDVSRFLRDALLQALQTTLVSLPPSAFPIPASTFWSSYILPARPVHAPGGREPLGAELCPVFVYQCLTIISPPDPSVIDVRHSTHKSVKAFLKACAKDGLIKLKDTKGGDVVVTGERSSIARETGLTEMQPSSPSTLTLLSTDNITQ